MSLLSFILFGISGFNFFFIRNWVTDDTKKNDTKENGEYIESRWKRLLSPIWMKFVPFVLRYLEFCLGGKNLPKVPDLAKYVKKLQKLLYCSGNLESEGLNFCSEFAYPFCLTLWEPDPPQKKPLRTEIKLFIDLHFQLLSNFCFSDYVTNTLISV